MEQGSCDTKPIKTPTKPLNPSRGETYGAT